MLNDFKGGGPSNSVIRSNWSNRTWYSNFLPDAKERVVFTGGSFRKGVRVPVSVPGEGVLGSGLGGWWGVVFLLKMKGKGEGGGGWGGDRERNRQVNPHAFVQTTL